VFLPPKDVVKLVQRFGWGAFLAAAGLMLALMLAVGSVLILRSRRPLVAGEPGEQPAVVAIPVSQQRSDDVVPSPAEADTLTNGHVDGPIEPPAPTPDAPALPAEHPQAAPAEARPAEAVLAPPEAPDVVMPEAVPADVLTEQVPPPAPALAEDVVSAAPIPDVVEPPAPDRRRVRWSMPRVTDAAAPIAAEPPSPARPPGEGSPPDVTSAPTGPSVGWAAAGRRAAARAAVSGRPADAPRRPQDAPADAPRRPQESTDRRRRSGRRVSRAQAVRHWIHIHQDVMWAVGLGAVVALVAGAFAGLI